MAEPDSETRTDPEGIAFLTASAASQQHETVEVQSESSSQQAEPRGRSTRCAEFQVPWQPSEEPGHRAEGMRLRDDGIGDTAEGKILDLVETAEGCTFTLNIR